MQRKDSAVLNQKLQPWVEETAREVNLGVGTGGLGTAPYPQELHLELL